MGLESKGDLSKGTMLFSGSSPFCFADLIDSSLSFMESWMIIMVIYREGGG